MFKLLVCVAAGLAVSGCATITRGTTDQVQIISDPSGADVRTSMGSTCITPCTLMVSRKDEFTVTFSKPGFVEENVPVKTQVAGSGAAGFAGNVLIGGIIGMGADAYTGATLEHVPNPVSVTLRPVAPPPPPVATRAAPKQRKPALQAPQS
jgi:hypothetical protein